MENNLQIVEHKGIRVLTTQQLAECYETSVDNIKMNFKRNKERFVEGRDYYLLKGEALKEFKSEVTDSYFVAKNVNTLYLWTERGANRHSKILDTDKAWQQFDVLEETYFKVKNNQIYQDSYMIEDPIKRAKRWIVEEEERQKLKLENGKLELSNKMKDQQIGELKPKADYCDEILKSKDLTPITVIAKDYGMSGCKLNKILHNLGIQYKQSGTWLLYSKYQDKGYTKSETVKIIKTDKTPGSALHTKWTQKGRLFLYELLKANDILPLIERNEEEHE